MTLDQLRNFALDNKIPIIKDDGLLYIIRLIKKHQVQKVLEIGTAVGYSAIAFSMAGCKVDSIEKDIKMFDIAKDFVKEFEANVYLYHADALEFKPEFDQYDLIFIDGPKGQYQKLFLKYQHYLKKDGLIVCDNINFHNLKEDEVSKRTASLLKKLKNFKTFLQDNQEFETIFIDDGDGLSISRRKV